MSRRPLWFYLPPLMRLLNWWDVRVRGKTVVRGIIKYAPHGTHFAPQFETKGKGGPVRKSEFIPRKPRK